MKKIFQNLLLFALLAICIFSYAQNNMEDVVYLKNGSVIRGVIIEHIPNQSIKIQTKDRNIFVFKYDEVEKMTKENVLVENSQKMEFKKRGFINITEINYCPGSGSTKVNYSSIGYYLHPFSSIGIRTVNGYQVSEHMSLGIGVGIDKYRSITMLPITFDLRLTAISGRFSPVLNAGVGYSVGLNIKDANGLVINPSIGIKTYISKNVAFLFNIGYKWLGQKNYYDSFYYNYNSPPKVIYLQYVTFNTGFSF